MRKPEEMNLATTNHEIWKVLSLFPCVEFLLVYSFHVILVILGPEAQEFGSYSHQDSDDLGGLILPYAKAAAEEKTTKSTAA